MSFAENLKNLRNANGYSQSELAALTGISQPTICHIEQGIKTNPKWETVAKLASKLNVTPVERTGPFRNALKRLQKALGKPFPTLMYIRGQWNIISQVRRLNSQ